jgi:hypothetical protein
MVGYTSRHAYIFFNYKKKIGLAVFYAFGEKVFNTDNQSDAF